MRAISALVFFLISFSSQANVFKPTSPLPAALKELILETIKNEVPCVMTYSLKETETKVTEEIVDQGASDFYYDTKIKGSYLFDRMHPAPMWIEIRTVDYKIDNPNVQRYFVVSSNLNEFICE